MLLLLSCPLRSIAELRIRWKTVWDAVAPKHISTIRDCEKRVTCKGMRRTRSESRLYPWGTNARIIAAKRVWKKPCTLYRLCISKGAQLRVGLPESGFELKACLELIYVYIILSAVSIFRRPRKYADKNKLEKTWVRRKYSKSWIKKWLKKDSGILLRTVVIDKNLRQNLKWILSQQLPFVGERRGKSR